MTMKQRLSKLRAECADWDDVIAGFTLWGGMSRRDAELGLLSLIDLGAVRIKPNPNGPTAFLLTLPDGIPDEVLAHV